MSLWRTTISPDAYRRVTAMALVALGAIIVTGAAVRLTSSGMGCPTWPSCEGGSLVPRGATGGHGWIEFLNRVFTGIVSVAVALAVLGSRRRDPVRADLTRWSWGLVAGVFAQALLGGLVVFLHVTPIAVAGHYLLSAVLVWNGVVLHHKASEPEPTGADRERQRRRRLASPAVFSRSRAVVALAGVVLVTGTFVTGSGPHGGDEAADRLPFAVTTVARIHSLSVWLFLAAVLVLLVQLGRGDADGEVMGRGRVLVALIAAQGALGYLQYFTGVPELLVGGHILGSVLVWVAALRFHLGLTAPLTGTVPTVGHLRPAPVAGAVP
ncbi:COX15/CtaA family protein [Nitrosomonas communis]|uniref:COX15/CtaA family protein n=1 Tax=Nitrosomonas communis TaxID=44574 RepID=UPI003D268514